MPDRTGVFGPSGGFSYEGGTIGKSTAVDGWYAYFIQFGTQDIPPNPFIKRGFNAANGTSTSIVINELKKSIKTTADREYRKWKRKYAKVRVRT